MILFLILACFTAAYAQEASPYKAEVDMPVLNHIRESYYHAVEYPESVDILIKYLKDNYSEKIDKYNPIILSYYGCLIGLKGKYESNVYSKVKLVNKGIEIIDSAAAIFPECFEIRFLRFSFFHFLPDFFNVKDARKNDLEFLVKSLAKKDYSFVPKGIQSDMVKFIVSTDRLSDDTEMKLLRSAQ